MHSDDESQKSVAISEKQEEEDQLEKPDEDDKEDEDANIVSDPALYDDLLKARQQFKSKRELFEANIDKSLSQEDRDLIMSRYDDQMQKMERDLLKE